MSPIERLPPELFHLILGFLEFETRLLDGIPEADADIIAILFEPTNTTETNTIEYVWGDLTLTIKDDIFYYRYPRRNEQRVDHLALRLCSRSVYSLTPRLPQLKSPEEWERLHGIFEARTGVKALLSLACMQCHKLLRSEAFSDSKQHAAPKGRFCISCGLQRKVYSKRSFNHGGVSSFACFSCQLAKPLAEETVNVDKAVKESLLGYELKGRDWRNTQRICWTCYEPAQAAIRATINNCRGQSELND
ncbi:hypothetical protein G7Y79_00001g000500 [Physcia stellaris]|nr:hypothetical protein G7Y79_00001g000500 [Physcia stellaris]